MHTHTLSRKHTVAALLVAVAILSVLGAMMLENFRASGGAMLTAVAATQSSDYQMFLKLDTIAGGSTDSRHKDEIEIDSFAWGESRSQGAARPSMEGLTVTLPAGKASPRLFLYTAGGLKISRGVLSVRKAGTADDFLKWIITDAQIVSYKTVGNTHGDGVKDQIVIVPAKIEVELKPADGSAVQKAGWDQRTGKSVGY
jgi:type VI secretion system secreted protein Hcp